MNLIYDNIYTQSWRAQGQEIPRPKAILCISAHWNTPNTQVTASAEPTQIFDFFGFPPALYEITYRTKGNPELADTILHLGQGQVESDGKNPWGLDHGSWAPLHHMYPEQNIPVLQLSLKEDWNAQQHFAFAKKLQPLREQGVLILGSGNIVHNLGKILWSSEAPAHEWAKEFEAFVLATLLSPASLEKKVETLFQHQNLSQAHPSLEHFYPLLYCLGATSEDDQLKILQKGIQNGSISMASLLFSAR